MNNMGSGSYAAAGPGLLRRRYSVPEIIMRKHSLQLERNSCENSVATTEPPPSIPSPIYCSSDVTRSSGSDSNIVSHNGETSMRRQLLRRIWSKEYRQYDARSGSWSPPMRRSQRRFNIDTPERCKACTKIDQTVAKRVRHFPSRNSSVDSIESIQNTGVNNSVVSSNNITSNSSNTNNIENSSDTPIERSDEVDNNNTNSLSSSHENNAIFIQEMITTDLNENRTIDCNETLDNSDCRARESIESIIDSRVCQDENRNDLMLTAAEETDNVVSSVNGDDDQYASRLLIDSLNNLVDVANGNQKMDEHTTDFEDLTDNRNETVSSGFSISVIRTTGSTNITLNESSPQSKVTTPKKTSTSEEENDLPRYNIKSSSPENLDLKNGNTAHTKDTPNVFPMKEDTYFATSALEGSLNHSINVAIIPVHTGSSYPNTEFSPALMIPRSIYRTESTEAQLSTASPIDDDDDDVGDSDNSLVDSLEDSTSPCQSPIKEIGAKYEKSEAFFIPIIDTDHSIDSPLGIATNMPDRLKDKLSRRQQNLDYKRQEESVKKQKKMKKVIDRSRTNEHEIQQISKPMKMKTTISSSSISSKSSKSDNGLSSSVLASIKASKNNFLRSEVGLLETYTIDAKGNIKFKQPQKIENNACKRTTSIITGSNYSKRNDNGIMKRTKVNKMSSAMSLGQRRTDVIKAVQQVTSDMVTPDKECGPRRIYQKTEILDGEKRIEILEIVECIDSGDSSPGYDSNELMRPKSKIPIPVPSTSGKMKKPLKYFRQSGVGGGCGSGSPNSKVDQMIADLLIEALNHPKELGIEFVKSPKDLPRTGTGKRMSMTRRIAMPNTSRRSANSATKYQQVFEVIPEEKSSMSVDSSNDEIPITKMIRKQNNSTQKRNLKEIPVVESSSSSSNQSRENGSCPGKAAVENEFTESNAWIGFFKHNGGGSIDSGNEDIPIRTDEIPQKTVKVVEKPSKTIKETNSSKGVTPLVTPIQSVDLPTHSSISSDNILQAIEKNGVTPKTASSTMSPEYLDISSLNSPCVQCKLIQNQLSEKAKEISAVIDEKPHTNDKEEFSKSEPLNLEESNDKTQELWPQTCDTIQSNDSLIRPETIDSVLDTSPRLEIDSTSFIILRDDPPNITQSILNITNEKVEVKDIWTETVEQNSSRSRCSDCCFCNPNLHSTGDSQGSKTCNYCNQKENIPKVQETETKSTNTINIYESMSTMDHVHIRTKDKDSDTVSLKCTKTNSKIRRFIPDEVLKAGLIGKKARDRSTQRVKPNSVLPKKSPSSNQQQDVPEPSISARFVTTAPIAVTSPIKRSKLESKFENLVKETNTSIKPPKIRLPSPFVLSSSSSYDDSSSPTRCSNSNSSSSNSNSPKKCPVILPCASRWQQQQQHQLHQLHQQQHQHRQQKKSAALHEHQPIQTTKIRNSRYHEFYGNNDNITSTGRTLDTNQNTGWSLTLAGTYRDNMAPDVEMKLSFPRKSMTKDEASQNGSNLNEKDNNKLQNGNLNNLYNRQSSDENLQNNRAALPPPPQLSSSMQSSQPTNLNPKRTLSKVNPDRLFNSRRYNLPEVNEYNGPVARQTAKKTIKQSEFTAVAVASATRTVSNFGNNRKRALSFQALNASAFQLDNRRERYRDHSIDLGHISSRRMSLESQTPREMMALSILGNAIAPEQKPRVPTMSERDLTRRQASNFTRNRAFFS